MRLIGVFIVLTFLAPCYGQIGYILPIEAENEVRNEAIHVLTEQSFKESVVIPTDAPQHFQHAYPSKETTYTSIIVSSRRHILNKSLLL